MNQSSGASRYNGGFTMAFPGTIWKRWHKIRYLESVCRIFLKAVLKPFVERMA